MDLRKGEVYQNFGGDQGREVVKIEDNKVFYVKYDIETNCKDTQVKECKISSFRKWADRIVRFPFKRMASGQLEDFKAEIKLLLHAHRDCLRNQGKDTRKTSFDVRDGYYGEAFGMVRSLKILGYGYFGSANLDAVEEHTKIYGRKPTNIPVDKICPEDNLLWWFRQIENEVLEEEGFNDGTYFCAYCAEKYNKGQY